MLEWLYRGLLVALIVLCLAATYWLLSGPIRFSIVQYEAQDSAAQEAQGDGSSPGLIGDVPNWLQFVAAAVVAYYSVLLYRLGDRQGKLLEQSNAKADTNIELTRKSIAAMEEANRLSKQALVTQAHADRGKLVYLGGKYDARTNQCTHFFRNIGRSPAVIRGFASDYVYARNGATDRVPNRSMRFTLIMDSVVMPEKFAAIKDDKLSEFGITAEHLRDSVVAEIEIVYFTLHEKWSRHAISIKMPDSPRLMKLPYENWDFEEEITDRPFPRLSDIEKGQRNIVVTVR